MMVVYGCFLVSQDERLKLRQEEEAAAAARLQDRRARAERRHDLLLGDGEEEEEGDNLEMVDIVLNRSRVELETNLRQVWALRFQL